MSVLPTTVRFSRKRFMAMLVVLTMFGVRVCVSDTWASLLLVKSVSELIGVVPLDTEFCAKFWYSWKYSASRW
jgi:hypothetical protein